MPRQAVGEGSSLKGRCYRPYTLTVHNRHNRDFSIPEISKWGWRVATPLRAPTPESRRGSPKVNAPSMQWISKVESANIGAFE